MLYVWLDQIVPFAMKLVALQVDALHLRIAYFASCRVFVSIQSTGDLQSLRSGCPGD